MRTPISTQVTAGCIDMSLSTHNVAFTAPNIGSDDQSISASTEASKQVRGSKAISTLDSSPAGDYPRTLHVQSRVSHIGNPTYPRVSDEHSRVSQRENTETVSRATDDLSSHILNPDAAKFVARNPDLVHRGVLLPDLSQNWELVQRVQSGGYGDPCMVSR